MADAFSDASAVGFEHLGLRMRGQYARMSGVKVIVITGGIASGKSTVVKMLQ